MRTLPLDLRVPNSPNCPRLHSSFTEIVVAGGGNWFAKTKLFRGVKQTGHDEVLSDLFIAQKNGNHVFMQLSMAAEVRL